MVRAQFDDQKWIVNFDEFAGEWETVTSERGAVCRFRDGWCEVTAPNHVVTVDKETFEPIGVAGTLRLRQFEDGTYSVLECGGDVTTFDWCQWKDNLVMGQDEVLLAQQL